MRLSAHFDSSEFRCHDGTPCPEHAYGDLIRLCRRYLEPLRGEFGPVIIVSGYRTRAHNAAVGGVRGSFHVYRRDRPGATADVRAARGRPAEWYAYLDELAVPGLGRYADHVHADNRQGHARW